MIPSRRARGHQSEIETSVVVPATVRTGPSATPRWSRRRGVVGLFAAFCALAFVAAYVGPTGAALAEAGAGADADTAISLYGTSVDDTQSLVTEPLAEGAAPAALERGNYTVYVKPKPTPTPTARSAAATASRPMYTGGGSKTEWLAASGIAESDWAYVDYIVSKESGWNPNATNKSSGACGLVQALPCSKVPGNGYDPIDNLRWANGYAVGRYGSWAGAYEFWISRHWW